MRNVILMVNEETNEAEVFTSLQKISRSKNISHNKLRWRKLPFKYEKYKLIKIQVNNELFRLDFEPCK